MAPGLEIDLAIGTRDAVANVGLEVLGIPSELMEDNSAVCPLKTTAKWQLQNCLHVVDELGKQWSTAIL